VTPKQIVQKELPAAYCANIISRRKRCYVIRDGALGCDVSEEESCPRLAWASAAYNIIRPSSTRSDK